MLRILTLCKLYCQCIEDKEARRKCIQQCVKLLEENIRGNRGKKFKQVI